VRDFRVIFGVGVSGAFALHMMLRCEISRRYLRG
jgi:hypothetical protein